MGEGVTLAVGLPPSMVGVSVKVGGGPEVFVGRRATAACLRLAPKMPSRISPKTRTLNTAKKTMRTTRLAQMAFNPVGGSSIASTVHLRRAGGWGVTF